MIYTKVNRTIYEGTSSTKAEVSYVKITVKEGIVELTNEYYESDANLEIVHSKSGLIFELCTLDKSIYADIRAKDRARNNLNDNLIANDLY